MWILNTVSLIKNLGYFTKKAFKKDKLLFEECLSYITEFKNALENGDFPYFKNYPHRRMDLIGVMENRIASMKALTKDKSFLFYQAIDSGLKESFYLYIVKARDFRDCF